MGQQDERTLLAEVRLLFGAVDPWLVEFMRAATARGSASAPPGGAPAAPREAAVPSSAPTSTTHPGSSPSTRRR
ncbi:hypothetical protein ACU686_37075 [Yinghuangia aomiensis]